MNKKIAKKLKEVAQLPTIKKVVGFKNVTKTGADIIKEHKDLNLTEPLCNGIPIDPKGRYVRKEPVYKTFGYESDGRE